MSTSIIIVFVIAFVVGVSYELCKTGELYTVPGQTQQCRQVECIPGYGLFRCSGDGSSDECIECQDDSFQSEWFCSGESHFEKQKCQKHTPCRPEGAIKVNGTKHSNIICECDRLRCLVGDYDLGGCTLTLNERCSAGMTLTSSDDNCQECPAGTFKNFIGCEPCMKCTVCPAGTIQEHNCTSVNNTVCVAVPIIASSSPLTAGEKAVIGIVLAVIFVIIVVVLVIIWRKLRPRRQWHLCTGSESGTRSEREQMHSPGTTSNSLSTNLTSPCSRNGPSAAAVTPEQIQQSGDEHGNPAPAAQSTTPPANTGTGDGTIPDSNPGSNSTPALSTTPPADTDTGDGTIPGSNPGSSSAPALSTTPPANTGGTDTGDGPGPGNNPTVPLANTHPCPGPPTRTPPPPGESDNTRRSPGPDRRIPLHADCRSETQPPVTPTTTQLSRTPEREVTPEQPQSFLAGEPHSPNIVARGPSSLSTTSVNPSGDAQDRADRNGPSSRHPQPGAAALTPSTRTMMDKKQFCESEPAAAMKAKYAYSLRFNEAQLIRMMTTGPAFLADLRKLLTRDDTDDMERKKNFDSHGQQAANNVVVRKISEKGDAGFELLVKALVYDDQEGAAKLLDSELFEKYKKEKMEAVGPGWSKLDVDSLNEVRCTLVKKLHLNEPFLSEFVSAHFLSLDTKEEIEKAGTSQRQKGVFLDRLEQGKKGGLDKLIEALNTTRQSELADLITDERNKLVAKRKRAESDATCAVNLFADEHDDQCGKQKKSLPSGDSAAAADGLLDLASDAMDNAGSLSPSSGDTSQTFVKHPLTSTTDSEQPLTSETDVKQPFDTETDVKQPFISETDRQRIDGENESEALLKH